MVEQAAALLIVERGAEDASVIPLDQQTHVIGRPPDADIILSNPYVSRRHVQIRRKQGGYQISDLGSKNGTYVNDERLGSEARSLNNGDRIELGREQVILRYQAWTTTITLPNPGDKRTERGILLDARSRTVRVQGIQLEPLLSRKEFSVLELLFRRRGEVCSKDQIAVHAWSERSQGDVSDQEIEQCIRRLRIRVESDPSQPKHVLTVRGYGYKLSEK